MSQQQFCLKADTKHARYSTIVRDTGSMRITIFIPQAEIRDNAVVGLVLREDQVGVVGRVFPVSMAYTVGNPSPNLCSLLLPYHL